MRKGDGGVLHYDARGPQDGPPIVLIEGLSAHMLGWREEFCQPFVDAGYHVIRFDNRDVGLSQHYPDQPYTLADLAEDTHELVRHLGVAPAHVVGQSMGGMVAQHLVLRHPKDVLSLTLLYTAPSADHVGSPGDTLDDLVHLPVASSRAEAVEIHVERERLCASPGYSFDEAWKRELGGLMWDRCYDPQGVVRQANALVRSRVDLQELAEVDVPTLLIHGTGDRLIPHAASVELNMAMPGSELWLIDELGHDLPRELWPDLTGRILRHLVDADRSSPNGKAFA